MSAGSSVLIAVIARLAWRMRHGRSGFERSRSASRRGRTLSMTACMMVTTAASSSFVRAALERSASALTTGSGASIGTEWRMAHTATPITSSASPTGERGTRERAANGPQRHANHELGVAQGVEVHEDRGDELGHVLQGEARLASVLAVERLERLEAARKLPRVAE